MRIVSCRTRVPEVRVPLDGTGAGLRDAGPVAVVAAAALDDAGGVKWGVWLPADAPLLGTGPLSKPRPGAFEHPPLASVPPPALPPLTTTPPRGPPVVVPPFSRGRALAREPDAVADAVLEAAHPPLIGVVLEAAHPPLIGVVLEAAVPQ